MNSTASSSRGAVMVWLVLAACDPVGDGLTPDDVAYTDPGGVEELTVEEFHAALASGTLTSAQLVRAYLDRIEAYDRRGPTLRAIIALNPDAEREARALDEIYRQSGPVGPLHGVPVLVKDSIDVAGMPTSGGTVVLAGLRPDDDAFIVHRLRAAGAVIVGKTNLDELQISAFGISTRGGQAVTPYALDRTAGGSSAGTGNGIAANFALIGVGADTNGSIRTPSGYNCLVGMRPTVGLISRSGSMPGTPVADVLGPMTRTVADLAHTLDVIVAPDPEDPVTDRSRGREPGQLYAEFLDPAGLDGARIGYFPALIPPPGDNDVAPVVYRAIDDLRAAGAQVVPLEMPAELAQHIDAAMVRAGQIGDVHRPWARYLANTTGTRFTSFSQIAARRSELFVNHALLLAPADVGDQPAAFATPPAAGDTVKAVFEVVVADQRGEPTRITAGWWILLDDVSRPDRWTGTLANGTTVPTTLARGSRVWIKPTQVVDHRRETSSR